MKIVQFLGSKGWGGLENIFVNLCNEFSKVVEIDVIIFKDSEAIKRFNKNVRVHELAANTSRLNPLLYIDLYVLLKNIQPDIIHTHGSKATQIFYYLNKLLHISHVGTKHNSRKGKVFNKLSHVIAVSKGVKKSIIHNNVKIIYNGINPVEVQPQMKQEVFTLLAIGRLDKIKGFDILINECAKLKIAFKLHIVGEGEERKNLENLIGKLGLEDKISLLGFRKDIPQLMRNADMVVMSSHSEGFSLVMVESLFYSNLFISTKVSGAIEILEDRFLFDGFNIANKLTDIYVNYESYKKDYLQLTQEIQDKFLLEQITQNHIAYYASILKKSYS